VDASGEEVQEEVHVLKINHAHVGIEQASERGSWGKLGRLPGGLEAWYGVLALVYALLEG
jgi:hypothetical protein